jgi:hypothetical protein
MAFPVWKVLENPMDHWKWKYLDPPLGSFITVAVDDDLVIGVAYEVFINYKLGESIVCGQYGADVATHQDYRGRGIYGRTQDLWNKDFIEKKLKMELSVSSNPIILNLVEKGGLYKLTFNIFHMTRIRDVGLHLDMRPIKNSFIYKIGFYVERILNRLKYREKSDANKVNQFTFTKINEFDERVDVFWENIKDSYHFSVEKRREYLNWRYSDPRAGNFTIIQAEKEEEILEFVVLQLKKSEDYEEGYVVDLLVQWGRVDVADTLAGYACKFFDDLNVNVIYYLATHGHPNQRTFAENGFLNSRRSPYIICKIAEAKDFEYIKSIKPGKIGLCYGDFL